MSQRNVRPGVVKGIQNVLSRVSLESTPSCSFCATPRARKGLSTRARAGAFILPEVRQLNRFHEILKFEKLLQC